DSRLPLTIVTGFLGSGKTTLVKNILSNTVGMKVLVIENEIGAEGIDHELLMQQTAPEEIVLMNNGCVCCTVRKDLLTTFHRLFDHEAFASLDWIVIETTGIADPAPLIQSLYMDAQCQARLRLDSVIAVVDCKHLPLHLTQKPAEGAGISFADRVLLNKTDLVTASELECLLSTVHAINPHAQLIACQNSQVPIRPKRGLSAANKRREQSREKEQSRHSVQTVSLLEAAPLDLDRFNRWVSDLLANRGADVFRLKGILRMQGYEEQFVAHGVHMIF
ncbi:CobW/HypB/UreG, nucleotide-binding domain-containing protein, partial [Ochromonadaceae sp. CCMP2298]